MKVLHVVQGYHPAVGGTELLIQKVSEKLVHRFGDEVTVFTTTGYNAEAFYTPSAPTMPPGVERVNGVTVKRFPAFNRLGPCLKWLQEGAFHLRLPFNQVLRALYGGPISLRMPLAIARFRGDVVAASSFPLLHMQYAVLGRRFNQTATVLVGGIHPEDPWGFDRPMIFRAIHRCDAYIAHTTYERDYLLQRRALEAARIHAVGVGVEVAPFEEADVSAIRTRYDLGGDPVVAFIGQQVKHKGVGTLVRAMPLVWRHVPEARLLIAGAPTGYSPQLRRIIEGLPAQQRRRVTLVNGFTEEEKPAFFAACDVLASPSGYESFGIVFLEAWACGKPVIGSRTGAISAVIDEGQDGLLVAYNDAPQLAAAILELLSDEALRRRLGARGKEKVATRYTWDIVAARFRAVYEQAIQAREGEKNR